MGKRTTHHRRGVLLAAACFGLLTTSTARAATTANWLSATSGNWTDATKWSTNPSYPNNGSPTPSDTYDVSIAATGSAYSVSLDTNITLRSFAMPSGDARVLHSFGTIQTTSSFDVGAGVWEFSGAASGGTIANTTITASTSGNLRVSDGAFQSKLDGVTLAAPLTIQPGINLTRLTLLNGLTLANGSIAVNGGGGNGQLHASGTQTISGTGALTLGGGSVSGATIAPTSGTLTLGPSVTVSTSAHGSLGDPSIGAVVNQGLVRSEVLNRELRIRGAFANQGTLRASNGGILQLPLGTGWSNTGVVELNPSSTLRLNGDFAPSALGMLSRTGGSVTVIGKLLNDNSTIALDAFQGGWVMGAVGLSGFANLSGGTVIPSGAMTELQVQGNSSFVNGVTLNCDARVATNISLQLFDGFTLNGKLALEGTTNNTTQVSSNFAATLGGTGQIVFDGSGTVSTTKFLPVNAPLVIGPAITVLTGTGSGTVGNSSQSSTTNQGLISARTSGQRIELDGAFTNQGTIEARNGASITSDTPATLSNLNAGTLSGGTWGVYGGSTMTFTGASITTNTADVTLSGAGSTFAAINSIANNSGSFTVTAGRDFATSGALSNTGRILVGLGSDLSTSGNLVESAAATLAMLLNDDFSAEGYGQMSVTGSANLTGTLEILFASGHALTPGDTFTLLTAASVDGTFSNITFPVGASGNVVYSPTSVVLTLTSVPEPGAAALLLAGAGMLMRRRRNQFI